MGRLRLRSVSAEAVDNVLLVPIEETKIHEMKKLAGV